MTKLKFSLGNAKLSGLIATFSLPAGFTCPCALECLSKSDRVTGQITDGPKTRFRCFSATNEARATNVRNARWHNLELLKKAKTVQGMADLIQNSLPLNASIVRLHVSGDFFNETYFKAWLNVAIANPHIVFYGYTKVLSHWIKHRKFMPENFRLVASKGGTLDALIAKYNLKFAEVVFSEAEAAAKGLEIDHDDSHAMNGSTAPFALLLHATQPKGSLAGEAWKSIRKLIGGYSRYGQNKRGAVPGAKSVALVVA
jgi:hypothetical protein